MNRQWVIRKHISLHNLEPMCYYQVGQGGCEHVPEGDSARNNNTNARKWNERMINTAAEIYGNWTRENNNGFVLNGAERFVAR